MLCRLDDACNGSVDGQGDYWQNTIGVEAIKGNNLDTTTRWGCDQQPGGECMEMWR